MPSVPHAARRTPHGATGGVPFDRAFFFIWDPGSWMARLEHRSICDMF